jgi:hypothetical protein
MVAVEVWVTVYQDPQADHLAVLAEAAHGVELAELVTHHQHLQVRDLMVALALLLMPERTDQVVVVAQVLLEVLGLQVLAVMEAMERLHQLQDHR